MLHVDAESPDRIPHPGYRIRLRLVQEQPSPARAHIDRAWPRQCLPIRLWRIARPVVVEDQQARAGDAVAQFVARH